MRPLTDHCPKPLLTVQGKPLMQWPLEALGRAGMRDVLVNTAWLGEQIEAHFGACLRFAVDQGEAGGACDPVAPAAAVRLHYSAEGRDFGAALETAGGIVRALPRLADPFWVLAGDVFAPQFDFAAAERAAFAASAELARVWLVPNPAHNPRGDFSLEQGGLAGNDGAVRYTYSTIGLYRHALFAPPYGSIEPGNPHGVRAALAPVLRSAVAQRKVGARLYTGPWVDVGTPERLARLNQPSNA